MRRSRHCLHSSKVGTSHPLIQTVLSHAKRLFLLTGWESSLNSQTEITWQKLLVKCVNGGLHNNEVMS